MGKDLKRALSENRPNRLGVLWAVRQALAALGAADHSDTASGLTLTVSFRALMIGYVMDRSLAVTGKAAGYDRPRSATSATG
ncbi:hypothetical protein [Ensifer sp. B1-9]|uniref:hypothetical protein n=1 Tax=Ensifer sp. B1-9 TaxID=3141455 RepID=UPI003D25D95D